MFNEMFNCKLLILNSLDFFIYISLNYLNYRFCNLKR